MKLLDKIEWTVQGDEILIVNTATNKIYTGNLSVKMILEEIIEGCDDEDMLIERIMLKLDGEREEMDAIKKDISETVAFFRTEGVVE
ncbi:hypothetical protein [Acetatifactor aquisgranensis]|uniref:hypothetical protein n=1 Tax=Acetatifactor aquisgranensis TaxID=2941233 RepID=UPI00203B99DB|nr:hypothetical protein [Acetatifactor aquisgranensis]